MNEKLKQQIQQLNRLQSQFRKQLQQKKEADSHHQVVQRMTREEKARAGIDRMTEAFIEHNQKQGKDVTESEVRKEVQRVAERTERRKD